MSHPYRGLPAERFWNSGVADAAPGLFDPVGEVSFTIERDDRIATLGSCFAQHVAASIRASGYRYLVTETAPEGSSAEKKESYGLFSARYGNVYTVAQAAQLLERAFDEVTFDDAAWQRDDRWYDAFRPTAEPGGFGSLAELEADRAVHLAAVRALFTTADVVVFTLGLTEGWRSRATDAVFPIAPGVVASRFDETEHEFINYDYPQVRADLDRFIARLREVNPGVRVILTVSPVPLSATFEKRNVWVSTTYSKAVLVAVAQDAARAHELVDYFPSFEVITSPLNAGTYYDDDLRSVRPIGVQHVMRLFGAHYLDPSTLTHATDDSLVAQYVEAGRVICDDELLDPNAK